MSPDRHAFEERRQRRIKRRQQRILAAAAQVFSQKGYANATTREIAQVADMAEGTLYNYYASKREILLAIASETEPPMERALMDAGPAEDRAALTELFEKALDVSEAQLPFFQTILNEAWVDDGILQQFVIARIGRIHQVLAAFIGRRVAEGTFRPMDPSLAAQLLLGLFASLLLPAVRGLAPPPRPEERRRLAQTVVDLLLDGVLARPG